jgi:hypothetical protein
VLKQFGILSEKWNLIPLCFRGCNWKGIEAAEHYNFHCGLSCCDPCQRAFQNPVWWQEGSGKLFFQHLPMLYSILLNT